jgi:carboxyl-terminal processing protease
LALVTLGACTETSSQAGISPVAERSLFIEADQSIIEFHIKTVSPEQLAMGGLGRLAALDPEISVERTAHDVVLRRGQTVKRFEAPEPAELGKWGVVTTDVLDAARVLSPTIAAVASDELDEMVIDSSLAQLDPFSRYARPAVAREHRAARDGFAGIGITLDIGQSDVRIASVMPDTPAATAGLLPDDRIIELDGLPVGGLSPEDIRRHLSGAAQTLVQLAVMRHGLAQPLEVTVQRANIVPETVTLREDHGIAWLKLRAFNQQTGQSLAGLLQRAHQDLGPNLQGIVLDLRGNPGGLLDQSVDVASLFLNGGDVLSTIGRIPQSQQHFVAPANPGAETLPMAVLIDGGSASASEIVAAALQDSDRAVVIGTSSYGKGTVQTVVRTANDGELTVTWAQIVTPRGYLLNTHGVVPTLCTATRDDAPVKPATLLSEANPVPADLARPRHDLDDTGWKNLRALCPAQRDDEGAASLVATQLLTDPTLYRRVLARMEGPRIAANH